ncbi:MAG: YabP/YqfC family sporulation protein [Oscillospiraceae bacterium]|nr:YabP/YqfC family sporulation protein [Oscillospiraceae bacterium]
MNKNVKQLALAYERVRSGINRHSSLQITDDSEIIADGCRKIVNCDENVAVIEQVRNRVIITGESLRLSNWGEDGVKILGKIKSISYEGLV